MGGFLGLPVRFNNNSERKREEEKAKEMERQKRKRETAEERTMVDNGDGTNMVEDDVIPSHQICLSLIKISMGYTFFLLGICQINSFNCKICNDEIQDNVYMSLLFSLE